MKLIRCLEDVQRVLERRWYPLDGYQLTWSADRLQRTPRLLHLTESLRYSRQSFMLAPEAFLHQTMVKGTALLKTVVEIIRTLVEP